MAMFLFVSGVLEIWLEMSCILEVPTREDDHMSPLDYFILMFPPKQLSAIVRLTNARTAPKRPTGDNDRRDIEVVWNYYPYD
jgi:hypothetical protein